MIVLPLSVEAGELRITVGGIRSAHGTVLIALYDSPASFGKAVEASAKEGFLIDPDRFAAVALRAKASKATLYRRWNGKVQLVIDALHHDHQQHHYTEQGPVDTGTLRGDLIAAFCGTGGLTDKPEVDTFGAILTAITRDAEFAEAFRTEVLAPKLAGSKALFERAFGRTLEVPAG